ncbi:retrovirus-related pol polyprotein from transposon TNT 1-94 [Tanacetum coccineum]
MAEKGCDMHHWVHDGRIQGSISIVIMTADVLTLLSGHAEEQLLEPALNFALFSGVVLISSSERNQTWIGLPFWIDNDVPLQSSPFGLGVGERAGGGNCHSIGTPLATKPKLDVDLSGEPVDQSDYRSKIGSLMCLTSSRPDLVQAVCYCARYQARPTQKHLKEVKRIFEYLKATINMGLWYPKDSGFELTPFSDADHAGFLDTRKSTSGGIQFLGDKLVSWMSNKQNRTAMSSAEAEYVALSASCAQVMWIRTQLQDYGFNYNKIPLTKYQLADMFTKALPDDRFKYLVRRIGMRCLTPADLEVVRLGINPMIQPEPKDLPKDNPKLEIAVLRLTFFIVLKFCNASIFLIGMQKQTAGTLKSVQANGQVDYLADTVAIAVWKAGNYTSMIVVWLFKRITTEDIGIDLNQGFDTFIEKKGNINSQHSPDSIELQSVIIQPLNITLSRLLKFNDGLWLSCGYERIIVFITNHRDSLNEALLRPGRMDVKEEEKLEVFHVLKYLLDKVKVTLAEIANQAAGGEGLFGNVFGGCISCDELAIQRRPYHRNCNCALHKSNENHCSHVNVPKVSYKIRRSWSEGCLVAMTSSAAAVTSPSPGSSPCCGSSPVKGGPPRLPRRGSTHQLNH